MRRVIDCSSAFKWVVVEDDSDKAIRLRDDFRAGLAELLAPEIFPAEIASALLSAQRKGRISDFQPPLFDILAEGVVLHATSLLLPDVGRIIASVTTGARVSLYDALYVALAEPRGMRTDHRRRPACPRPPALLSLHHVALDAALTSPAPREKSPPGQSRPGGTPGLRRHQR
jgi:predicted nucleic acid-binding protein